MKRVALVTSHEHPNLPVDERLAVPALQDVGIAAKAAIWSDPSVDWASFDAVVFRSCWDYYLEPARFIAWLDRLRALAVPVFNPLKIVEWNIRKTYLLELNQFEGVDIVPTELVQVDDPRTLVQVARDRGWPSAVVKPVLSAAGYETFRFSVDGAADEAERSLARIRSRGMAAMVQPFLPEILEEGERSLIFFGGLYSHGVLKRAAQGEFRVQNEHGGTIEAVNPPRAWAAHAEGIVRAAARRTGQLPLYARVDLVPVDGKPLLMELEMIEPSLYFGWSEDAPRRFARSLAERLVI